MQLDDFQADSGAHALDLMELPFLDDDRQGPGAGLDSFGRQAVQAIVEDDAAGKAVPYIFRDIPFDDGVVYLIGMLLR